MKKLSVLICSLENRQHLLQRLMDVLNPQLNDNVEVLKKIDNGEIPIGRKRNELLEQAQSEYVAFVDDDDIVSNDYISKILHAIEKKPDCCGLQGIITFQGKSPRMFIHSLKYKSWFEQNNVYYRCPNHLNAIKRSLAIQVKFPETNHGEDRDFSTRILPLLKTEEYINGVIYHYLYEKGGPPGQSARQMHQANKNALPRLRRW
jgi:glycosyltransferase involved in cell wall biosynthesis